MGERPPFFRAEEGRALLGRDFLPSGFLSTFLLYTLRRQALGSKLGSWNEFTQGFTFMTFFLIIFKLRDISILPERLLSSGTKDDIFPRRLTLQRVGSPSFVRQLFSPSPSPSFCLWLLVFLSSRHEGVVVAPLPTLLLLWRAQPLSSSFFKPQPRSWTSSLY